MVKYGVITYLRTYNAALMSVNAETCMYADGIYINIYIYIYIYIYLQSVIYIIYLQSAKTNLHTATQKHLRREKCQLFHIIQCDMVTTVRAKSKLGFTFKFHFYFPYLLFILTHPINFLVGGNWSPRLSAE